MPSSKMSRGVSNDDSSDGEDAIITTKGKKIKLPIEKGGIKFDEDDIRNEFLEDENFDKEAAEKAA